jgi:1-acyl-sn-glycerol-3-phosphate acyltransferase
MPRHLLRSAWGIYVGLAFATLLILAVLCVVLLPTIKLRRDASHALARLFFAVSGLPFQVSGEEHLPDAQAVVVANHASYLDGPLLYAALPARFGFVIKKEVVGIPLAGWLLRRLGHEFVDRHNKAESAKDARRILKAAFKGDSVAFFPEGTFSETPGLARFHSGAFVTAAKAGMPVVPVVIHGARHILPANCWWPRRGPLSLDILEPLPPPGPGETNGAARMRDEARRRILARLEEPDLVGE